MSGLTFDTVSKKLNALLESVDPEKTTTKDIFRCLTDELGTDVKRHKKGIRVRYSPNCPSFENIIGFCRIQEAIGQFFEAQEEEGGVKEKHESDDFGIQLDDKWHLGIVDVSGEHHVEISSKVVPSSACRVFASDGCSRGSMTRVEMARDIRYVSRGESFRCYFRRRKELSGRRWT